MRFTPRTMGRVALAALAVALTLSVSGTGHADVAPAGAFVSPPGGQVTLDVQTINGSGCPAGTAKVTMMPGNTGFRVTYSSFVAQTGGAAKATDFRKNCQINLLVQVPQGFTYAIARADYAGRAQLYPGASGLLRTNYYFQGTSDNTYVDHPFGGPAYGTWRASDITSVTDLVFEPCGQVSSLNINAELRVDDGTSGTSVVNYLSMGASDGSVDTIVQFQWMQCS